MTDTQTPVKVLTITGSARSGSTVLDVVLGNHPSIESVGEVNKLIRTGWISRESLRGINPKRLRRPICTCGKRLDVLYVDAPDEACPFWASVRREWVERTDPHSIESYPKLQNDFEPQSRWPRLLYEKRRASALFRSYAGLTRAFFESSTCGERETHYRGLFQDFGTYVRSWDDAWDRSVRGSLGT